MSQEKDEFYIGYMPEAPSGVGSFVKIRVIGLLVFVTAMAATIAVSFSQLGPATFEFGNYRSFEGCIEMTPYPHLAVHRPGSASEEGVSRYYLTVFGKYGAESHVEAFANQKVQLEGQLIFRDHQTMIEIKDGSVVKVGDADIEKMQHSIATETLEGEIIDSKCYLGVMNPGSLKGHKACAINCIRGGIPPMLLVRGEDRARYYLLVDQDGKPVNQEVLDKVAVPVRIQGQVERLDNLYILRADPEKFELI
jgi:hypothetical protein